MTDAERTLLLMVAASVRADLLNPWNTNKLRDAHARAESIAELAAKVQQDAKPANDNQTETETT